MNKKPSGKLAVGIAIAVAFLIFALLIVAFFTGTRGNARDSITLPEAHPQEQAPIANEPEELFLSVDASNIQSVLDRMSRPEAYHQMLTISTMSSGKSGSKTVELWEYGNYARAIITEQSHVQHLMTDGEFLWIWYEGDSSPAELLCSEEISFDDIVGIPTYETLVALEPTEITDAGFLALHDMDDTSCLYIASTHGDFVNRYWVDAATQLLCKADSLYFEQQIYQLRQNSCEMLMLDEASLREIFLLPNGIYVIKES